MVNDANAKAENLSLRVASLVTIESTSPNDITQGLELVRVDERGILLRVSTRGEKLEYNRNIQERSSDGCELEAHIRPQLRQ